MLVACCLLPADAYVCCALLGARSDAFCLLPPDAGACCALLVARADAGCVLIVCCVLIVAPVQMLVARGRRHWLFVARAQALLRAADADLSPEDAEACCALLVARSYAFCLLSAHMRVASCSLPAHADAELDVWRGRDAGLCVQPLSCCSGAGQLQLPDHQLQHVSLLQVRCPCCG